MAEQQPKMCRICWNLEQWSRPSGHAAKLEGDSYVSEHGFGHEEWLFNFEWMIDGSRNGFVQGIHKYYEVYKGKRFPLLLYTIDPDRSHLAVAFIRSVYVPTDEELSIVSKQYVERGWLGQMRDDLERINVTTDQLDSPTPQELANVRFRPEDVHRFDPMPFFLPGQDAAPNLTARYMAFNWNGDLSFLNSRGNAHDLGGPSDNDPRRSEDLRRRAAQQGTVVDPKHVRMQNALFNSLARRHESVLYENNFVDLTGRDPGLVTYYELKTAPTARMCIRQALGQLLEYSEYPKSIPADRLVVVGEAPATQDDVEFLKTMRNKFHLPLQYGWFRWEAGELADLV